MSRSLLPTCAARSSSCTFSASAIARRKQQKACKHIHRFAYATTQVAHGERSWSPFSQITSNDARLTPSVDTRIRSAQSFPSLRKLYTAAETLQTPRDDPTSAEVAPSGVDISPDGDNTFFLPTLPSVISCPGCGAFAQTVEADQPGYYTSKRRVVRDFLKHEAQRVEPNAVDHDGTTVSIANDRTATQATTGVEERAHFEEAANLEAGVRHPAVPDARSLDGVDRHKRNPKLSQYEETKLEIEALPFCDRCHDLQHHGTAQSIFHPSVDSIADTIDESPYKSNHIYHVLDAADFPMSLVPNITQILHMSPLRSQNRRAKHMKFKRGKRTEISFVITRADLLARQKDQVDRLMPKMVEILRKALGREGHNVRLGNVYCVSARRGWWTKALKTDIWDRGGASWLLGKVNVGKSNLYETIFPKGNGETINFDQVRSSARSLSSDHFHADDFAVPERQVKSLNDSELSETSLLPPARKEVKYPIMPIVSGLPGTTASPIRIPFGNGKGELIDLPGLKRTDLEQMIHPEKRQEVMLKRRPDVEQFTIKPGKSLLIGGIVRVTAKTDDIIVLAYPFINLKPHLTSTAKALEMEQSPGKSSIFEHLLMDNESKSLQSAGIFKLDTDVTKARAGPLTSKSAVGLKVEQLPFRVLSTDILVESLGWIELATQVRTKDYPIDMSPEDRWDATSRRYPEVEVFAPRGKFISSRKSLGAWLLSSETTKPGKVERKGRPRRSLGSDRKRGAKALA